MNGRGGFGRPASVRRVAHRSPAEGRYRLLAFPLVECAEGAYRDQRPENHRMEIRTFATTDADAVVALWEEAGLTRPWNDPRKDIDRKLAAQPELFFVAVEAGTVIGVVMAGYEGHRGSINYLATAPSVRGQGVGVALVAHAEACLLALGCPKVNLQVRLDNDAVVGFYERLGYERFEVVDLGKRLIED